jgi:hypothetical protein
MIELTTPYKLTSVYHQCGEGVHVLIYEATNLCEIGCLDTAITLLKAFGLPYERHLFDLNDESFDDLSEDDAEVLYFELEGLLREGKIEEASKRIAYKVTDTESV